MGKIADRKEKQLKSGVEKVKFWIIALLAQLSAALGLWIGLRESQQALPAMDWESIKLWFLQLWQPFRAFVAAGGTPVWIGIVLGVFCGIALVYFSSKYEPKKNSITEEDWLAAAKYAHWVLYVLLVVLFVFVAQADGNAALLLSKLLLLSTGITVITVIMVLRDVYVNKNSTDYDYFEKEKKSVLQKTTLLGLVLAGCTLLIPEFWGFSIEGYLAIATPMDRRELMSFYTAFLSLTFISISVMSVLSDRSVVIYWENIAEAKLIKPVFGSFAALTYYSIGAAVGAGLAVVVRNTEAFFVFCGLNVLFLIMLTFSMVDVYYDRVGKMHSLRKELHDAYPNYLKICSLEEKALSRNNTADEPQEVYTEREKKDMRVGHDNYVKFMMLLCQNIAKAQESHDLLYLEEVYALYQENVEYFNNPEGKRVSQKLFAECTTESWPQLMRSLEASLRYLEENQQRDRDPFRGAFWESGNLWNQDEALWAALATSEQLPRWLESLSRDPLDTAELRNLIWLISCRLVVLYNDMVSHIKNTEEFSQKEKEKLAGLIENSKYLCVSREYGAVFFQTEDGEKPDPDQIGDVFGVLFGKVVVESSFVSRLVRILYMMLTHLSENGRSNLLAYLREFPLLQEFSPFAATLGLEEEEEKLWKEAFPPQE